MPIKLLIVEDHDILRNGVRSLLEGDSSIEVIGEASNWSNITESIKKNSPDVVLLGINSQVMNDLETTRKIKKEFPELKVLLLSTDDHEKYLIDMLDTGANGYVLKKASRDELTFAIRKITNDGIYMGSEFTLGLLFKYKSISGFVGQTSKASVSITNREREVLNLMAEGFTNAEMANKLFTSVRTIETRRKNLLIKQAPITPLPSLNLRYLTA